MICSVENSEFIEKILQMRAKDVKSLLNSEDEKYIIRKKHDLIRNMPQILKPNQNIESQTDTFIKTVFNLNFSNQNKDSKKPQFPSSFQEKNKGSDWDLKSKFLQSKLTVKGSKQYLPNTFNQPYTFESGIEGQFGRWKGQTLPGDISEEVLKEKQEGNTLKAQFAAKNYEEQSPNSFAMKENDKQLTFKQLQKQLEGKKLGHEADNQVSLRESQPQNINKNELQNPFAPPFVHQSKHSPFISNKTNFLDLHTNKKSTQPNYVSPQTYSMNMLQFAYNQKRQNTFDDRYSYPNIIMGGTGTGWMKTAQEMRENPFTNTFVPGGREGQLTGVNHAHYQSGIKDQINTAKMQTDNRFRENVQNVLKYTLGDKRYTANIAQRNYQQSRVENNMNNGLDGSMKMPGSKNREKVLENPFVRRPASTYKY